VLLFVLICFLFRPRLLNINIFSGNTSYTYWFVFISPLDDNKTFHILYPTNSYDLQYICRSLKLPNNKKWAQSLIRVWLDTHNNVYLGEGWLSRFSFKFHHLVYGPPKEMDRIYIRSLICTIFNLHFTK
jgi:hypothetical protein